MSERVTAAQLTEPREAGYFMAALVVSILVWAACAILIVPILVALGLALSLWLANGLLVAQLKAEAVKIDEVQMPGLAAALARVCGKLDVSPVPELYVMQSGGLLNAFATRHCGRSFVVIYSEILEAYGPESAEIEFLLGHEVGHIKRNHLLKRLLVLPGLLVPLLGNAYSRACELTCDRHGAYATGSLQGAVNAMLILAGGRTAPAQMTPEAFGQQYAAHRGFFVSWHELISGYPTLSHRVAHLLALRDGRPFRRAPRNAFGYLFALFTLGGSGGGGAQMILTVVMVGLVASAALPALAKARAAAREASREAAGRLEMQRLAEAEQAGSEVSAPAPAPVPARPAVKGEAACFQNLRLLDAAKEQAALVHGHGEGDAVPVEEIREFLGSNANRAFACPEGGSYTLNPVGREPACSKHGTLSK